MEEEYRQQLRAGDARRERGRAGGGLESSSGTRWICRAAWAVGAACTPASRRTTRAAIRRCSGSGCSRWRTTTGIDFAHADAYYETETVPAEGHFYVPGGNASNAATPLRQESVPSEATWQEPDGIVGHRLRLVHRLPLLHDGVSLRGASTSTGRRPELSPDEGLNHRRPIVLGEQTSQGRGVVEKCTFCIHSDTRRTATRPVSRSVRQELAQVRKLARSEESEVRHDPRPSSASLCLKSELKTLPRFYYFYRH